MLAEFKELLSIFNAKSVRYLVVGGYAVSLHAQPRTTQDIDILIAVDEENAERVFAALQEFGAPLAGLKPGDFAERGKFFRMGRAPYAVDILPEIDGIDFEPAWKNRAEVVVDEQRGLKALFISSEDLIANKLASGRPQDIADVAALRDAAKKSH
ncbi:MAG TPA: DUF6036 family nucleotidyltransferase [Candidatus Eisenbacteria bacterium]|nr:DUF6036 family nucleotidyltransferase [Candidatus Eisenbacteria bacterium]